MVNGTGLIGLAGRQFNVGYQLAGQRVTLRMDGTQMTVISHDGELLRTMPCPVPPGERHRLRGARRAAPTPAPAAGPVVVQRRVSQRGSIMVATQRIHVGMIHAQDRDCYRQRLEFPHLPGRRDNLRRPAYHHARDPPLQGLREQGGEHPMTSPPPGGYEHDAQPVKAALAAAGIETRDFGRFVNRPVPGVIEPADFDAVRALPVLLEWLPQVRSEQVREAIVRHLAVKTGDSQPADTLIEEYRRPGSANHKWVVADALAFACTSQHFAAITGLAADSSQGISRSSRCSGGSRPPPPTRSCSMPWDVSTPPSQRCRPCAAGWAAHRPASTSARYSAIPISVSAGQPASNCSGSTIAPDQPPPPRHHGRQQAPRAHIHLGRGKDQLKPIRKASSEARQPSRPALSSGD
jgi:hypothetical protein